MNTAEGIDISLPIRHGSENANAWYCDPVSIEPVRAGDFVGEIAEGGSVNFRNIKINPHGNCTHTECVGHIAKEVFTINQCLKEFHFLGQVVTVKPVETENSEYGETDLVIEAASLPDVPRDDCSVLLLRTIPNSADKKTRSYSGENPPYLSKDAAEKISCWPIDHLMIDLPSVDREKDNGALTAHKIFWNYPDNPQLHKTITELIYIPDHVADGVYLVSIQIMSIESDASPSKIMLYRLQQA